jgi:nitrate reductase gamma subunit
MMQAVYSFVSGPLAWISFIIFIGGSLYRLISMALLAKKKDPMVYAYMSPYYALRSICHWIIPFASVNSRKQPIFTLVTFVFHACLILMPIFLFAHVILWKQSWDISWWFISDGAADFMTLLVIGGCVFFMVRRMVQPEVKYLTSPSDFILLAIVAAPFVTGFWSYHQWIGYRFMGISHMITGEIMLAAIPFTRLSHMLFFPFTRGYMGSEFGAIRHAKDW